MKLILHHLAKDIRAQRWLLLLWAFILAIHLGCALLILHPDFRVASVANQLQASPLLALTGAVVWIFLLVQLIQAEPVVGSTSFWLTRPVPRGVYIPSKLLFLTLFLFTPKLLLAPAEMVLFGCTAGQIWHVIVTTISGNIALVLGILWMATFTRTLTQFFGVLVLLVPVALTAYGLNEIIWLRSNMATASELLLSRGVVFNLVMCAALALSLAVQHTVRLKRTGLIIGVAGAALATLLGYVWPFALPPQLTLALSDPGDWHSVSSVDVTFQPGWQDTLTWRPEADGSGPTAFGTLVPIGQKNSVTVIDSVAAGIHPNILPYSTGLPASGYDYSPKAGQETDFMPFIKNDLPDITVVGAAAPAPPTTFALFKWVPKRTEWYRGKPGELSLRIRGHVETLSQKFIVPLREPASLRFPGGVIHVRRQDQETRSVFGFDVNMGEARPLLAIWSVNFQPPVARFSMNYRYVLVNPEAHTGVILERSTKYPLPSDMGSFGWTDYVSISGTEPLDRMVLYIYEFNEGFFDTDVKAPNYVLNPP